VANLLVFSDDWGRHPSSCQHLIGHLLGKHRVYWINTIGTRRPSLDLATLKRAYEKARHWGNGKVAASRLPPNLTVLTPKMWPWFSSPLHRKLNRELLYRQLAPVVRSLSGPVIAVSTIPIVADLVDVLPVDRWVYYCVDDFGEWPGLDQSAMKYMEEKLIRRADVFVAVSQNLRDKLARRGKEAQLLTHGVDVAFWQDAQDLPLPQLNGLENPLIVFWGVLDRRMDAAWVRQLAADLHGGTIVFVGPEADPDPDILACPRVVHLPPVSFESLPRIARRAAVLVMPYADLPVTRALQPLKLKEYLATGRPVVARDLPATRPWAECADLASTAASFSELVRARLRTGLPESQKQARVRLQAESWAEKARRFENWAVPREELATHAAISY
jgi:glycosyltransferase involved in cell wall biosynthesis